MEVLLRRVNVKNGVRQMPVDPWGTRCPRIMRSTAMSLLIFSFNWVAFEPWVLVFMILRAVIFTYTYHVQNAYFSLECRCCGRGTRGGVTVPLPRGSELVIGDGDFAGSLFFVWYYVDDGVLVERRGFADGRRSAKAIHSLAMDYFRLLGNRRWQSLTFCPVVR